MSEGDSLMLIYGVHQKIHCVQEKGQQYFGSLSSSRSSVVNVTNITDTVSDLN